MKVGIITFWQTRDNYGQVLQCFALQCFLRWLGHDPYLIKYAHSEVKASLFTKVQFFIYNLFHLNFGGLFLKASKLPDESEIDKERGFSLFKKKYIFSSDGTYYSLNELRNNPPLADVYLVGSDQVWFKTLRFYENRTFFLDFGKKETLRIAYAASFAMLAYPKSLNRTLRKMLNRFSGISVRENSGIDICRKAGVNAEKVLDPTLLLHSKEYEKILGLKKKITNDCFIYCLNISSPEEIFFSEIKQISEKKDLKIVITPASGYVPSRHLFENVEYRYHSIESWIEQIASSKLVVTTSFHGVVFCILFHTPFIYVPLQGRFSVGNNRIIDLLSSLGLERRMCVKKDKMKEIYETSVDWFSVDESLDSLRIVSETFLRRTLNG